MEYLTKVCPRCGRELPLGEFYKDKQTKNGLSIWCKSCHKERDKLRYNPSIHVETSRKYYKCVKNPSCPRVGERGAEFETFICEICGTEFRRRKAQVDYDYEHHGYLPKFCSKDCKNESQRKSHKSKYAKEIERIQKEVGK